MNTRYSIYILILVFISILILLSNCSGWLTTLGDNSPRKLVEIKEHNFKGKVIVIGAGASGLAAAALLEDHGVEYQIIEATDHYGGRILKNSEFADFPVDLGAEWIHQKKDILNRLIDKEGKEPEIDLIKYRTLDSYSWNGAEYKKSSMLGVKLMYWSFPEYKFKSTTWFDYLEKSFAQKVKHKIIYNSPIKHINYTNDKVEVNTGNGAKYFADKVIVTVPLGVLKAKQIEFTPALPKAKMEAIQSVEFLPGFKLFLKFSEKFYPDMLDCETKDGNEKSYFDVAFGKDTQDNVLGLLLTGVSVEDYYKLGSETEIINSVLEELDVIFDEKASAHYLNEYLFEDWGRQKFTLGTYTDSEDGISKETLKALVQPMQNKVYFAGEAYDKYRQRGSVQGTVMSGYTTVYNLLEGDK